MALKFSTALRNARANTITVQIGSGATLCLYSGTRPATPDTALGGAVLLAQLTMSTPAAPTALLGVLLFSGIAQSNAAVASGLCTWFSIQTSANARVFDGDVSVAGGTGDLVLNSTAVIQGGPVLINSYQINEPA